MRLDSSTGRTPTGGSRWHLVVAAAALAAVTVAAPAVADTAFPYGSIPDRAAAGTAWTGEEALLFGGFGSCGFMCDTIVSYDPAEDEADVLGTRLPDPMVRAAAVWDPRDRPSEGCPGGCAFVFGGSADDLPNLQDTILRYNPATDSLTTMDATLPEPVNQVGAVWAGDRAILFGGFLGCPDFCDYSNEILTYVPGSGQVTTRSATLPWGDAGLVAVWDGEEAHVLGGDTGAAHYDPSTDTLEQGNAAFPRLFNAAGVTDGEHAFVFGGDDCSDRCERSDQIYRYNLSTDEFRESEARLPSPREEAGSVWTGSEAFVLGGRCTARDLTTVSPNCDDSEEQVVRYDPDEDPVDDLEDILGSSSP